MWVNDDRVGRALDALFDADRASLLTKVVLRAVSEFAVDTAQLHNDSTSVSVHGVYSGAVGTPGAGRCCALPYLPADPRREDLCKLRAQPRSRARKLWRNGRPLADNRSGRSGGLVI